MRQKSGYSFFIPAHTFQYNLFYFLTRLDRIVAYIFSVFANFTFDEGSVRF